MSGPTRQRSLRERLHGIGISWQGKKSKSYHSKDNQTFSETEIKSGSLDSRSCDPIPSCDENIDKVPSSESDTPKDVKKESFSADADLPQAAAKVHEKTEEKCPEQKESSHTEKRSLCRTVTRPKGTQEYMVQASDTLAGIAARFDTTPSELAKLNRLPSRLIFPGQSLFVPEKKSVPGEGEDEHRDSTKFSSTQEYEDTPQGARGSLGDNVLSGDGLIGNGAPNLQRKASVTDPLRIPYRRHSERMQRFLKVKARHFTDGQGVVSGVLIITPNAVMFDPNVSDPLVIEHGTESYGVIAPLDMVMRTAIYFDIAHMKVKNVPETQINIPKADIYYGKQTPKSALPAEHEESLLSSATTGAQETPEKEHKESTDDNIKASDTDNKGTNKDGNASPENIISHKGKDSDEGGINISSPKAVERKDVDPLESTESPLKKESKQNELVSLIGKQLQGPKSTRSLDDNFSPKDENCREFSVINIDSKAMGVADSSLPQMDTEKPTESRRERMLKRLSYPMESITSYTQSSISRILSSSPKSLVDFSSGLFVRTSEEEKGKESNQVVEISKDKNREDEQVSDALPEDTEEFNGSGSQMFAEDDTKIEETSTQSEKQEKSCQESEFKEHGDSSVIGYKNFVEDKPEVFAVLDKLLGQYNEQENEGPPLYLCLRMGHPKERKLMVSTPILSYGKKRAKPEYWFSIPHNRVEDLYTFIQQWIPSLYGDVDEVNPDELGFIPIDDTEESEEEQNEETKEESDKQNEFAEDEEQRKTNPRSFLKLVEDHFGFRSISPTDWEVLSMNEADIVPSIELELPLPELLSPSEIFNETHVKQLYPLLPARACGYPWTMIFSTSANGFSLKTMYRRMALYDTPILLAVADTDGAVFGALLSSALKPSDYFYGTGESFLYTFHPEFKVFKWTGDNLYFIKGNIDSVAIGSGDGLFGLWLDADLYRGSSKKCLTFNNTPLSSSEDFTITALEAWGFV